MRVPDLQDLSQRSSKHSIKKINFKKMKIYICKVKKVIRKVKNEIRT